MINTVNAQAQTTVSWARYFTMHIMLIMLLAACGEVEVGDGDVINGIPLPLDSDLTLFCEDVGIAEETCILDDPENPYASISVNGELEDNDDNEPNRIRKFVLTEDAPSAKARFYLWATAQAQSPRGENQYYTALSLHEVFTESGSVLIREQAKKAYRSVLDNYFNEVTFFLIELPEGDVFFPELLRKLVGENMYEPGLMNLTPLYASQLLTLEAFGQWGYYYDVDTGFITRSY